MPSKNQNSSRLMGLKSATIAFAAIPVVGRPRKRLGKIEWQFI
ncbi:hypothetical protein [Aetokthonos hydrillicola]